MEYWEYLLECQDLGVKPISYKEWFDNGII